MSDTKCHKTESKGGNTIRFRRWCFTWNNYTDDDIKYLVTKLKGSKRYVFQEEICPTTGTPHLQGYAEWDHAIRFSTLKNWDKKIHWKKCENYIKAQQYCQKDRSLKKGGKRYLHNILIENTDPEDEYDIKQEKPWQREIIKIIQGVPDKRKIYWYWSNKGNVGKSTLALHLILKYDAIEVGGTKKDIAQAIRSRVEAGKNIKIALIDISRSAFNKVSYQAIEALKNQKIFCPKYESSMLVFKRPHVIVFANYPPEIQNLSQDRWMIHCIDPLEKLDLLD